MWAKSAFIFTICWQAITTMLLLTLCNGLPADSKDKSRFCPHFVQWLRSVSIGTIRLFPYCLSPQFRSVKLGNLSVRVEFLSARVLASKRLNKSYLLITLRIKKNDSDWQSANLKWQSLYCRMVVIITWPLFCIVL